MKYEVKEIVASRYASYPFNAAVLFSACLAADKGVPSEVVPTTTGYIVVADDGKAVEFLRR